MTEPTACCAARCSSSAAYCGNCDLLVGLEGLHVLEVVTSEEHLRVRVESPPGLMGCPSCGVVALSHGRRGVELIDAPCFARPVRIVWWKRTWWCGQDACPVGVFTEQDDQVARPRALLTARACWWAVGQLRREHASVLGLARQLGTSWKTVWRAIKPLLEAMDADSTRFDGVEILGVDEHIWHHVNPLKRGPKELTGMVNLTRDAKGKTRAALLDLVAGRSGAVYRAWLQERGETFRTGVKIATLDPFQGYKNAIDDELQDAVAVVDAFHVVKLGGQAIDEVRRRVQQETLGHRGHAGDPLYGIRMIMRCGRERLTERLAWLRRSLPTNAMTRSISPGRPPRSCARRSTTRTPPRAAGSLSTSSRRSRPARSRRSPDSAGPCVSGASRSWPTSPPPARTTAAPRPSTD